MIEEARPSYEDIFKYRAVPCYSEVRDQVNWFCSDYWRSTETTYDLSKEIWVFRKDSYHPSGGQWLHGALSYYKDYDLAPLFEGVGANGTWNEKHLSEVEKFKAVPIINDKNYLIWFCKDKDYTDHYLGDYYKDKPGIPVVWRAHDVNWKKNLNWAHATRDYYENVNSSSEPCSYTYDLNPLLGKREEAHEEPEESEVTNRGTTRIVLDVEWENLGYLYGDNEGRTDSGTVVTIVNALDALIKKGELKCDDTTATNVKYIGYTTNAKYDFDDISQKVLHPQLAESKGAIGLPPMPKEEEKALPLTHKCQVFFDPSVDLDWQKVKKLAANQGFQYAVSHYKSLGPKETNSVFGITASGSFDTKKKYGELLDGPIEEKVAEDNDYADLTHQGQVYFNTDIVALWDEIVPLAKDAGYKYAVSHALVGPEEQDMVYVAELESSSCTKKTYDSLLHGDPPV